jgi:hypothetical protein
VCQGEIDYPYLPKCIGDFVAYDGRENASLSVADSVPMRGTYVDMLDATMDPAPYFRCVAGKYKKFSNGTVECVACTNALANGYTYFSYGVTDMDPASCMVTCKSFWNESASACSVSTSIIYNDEGYYQSGESQASTFSSYKLA